MEEEGPKEWKENCLHQSHDDLLGPEVGAAVVLKLINLWVLKEEVVDIEHV